LLSAQSPVTTGAYPNEGDRAKGAIVKNKAWGGGDDAIPPRPYAKKAPVGFEHSGVKAERQPLKEKRGRETMSLIHGLRNRNKPPAVPWISKRHLDG